ncbi:MAG: bifunctional precorrin-2 dehydrogenase/sirohydrochlorin ferrochelatase [Alphaproteobacteria bacterium]
MFPIVADVTRVRIAVVGNGGSAARRLAGLDAAGAGDVVVFADRPSASLSRAAGARLRRLLPKARDLEGVRLLLIAGIEDGAAARVAKTARALGILVNVEDRKAWCDFHVPSVIRRGDLVMTVSTNGRCPGLARRLRQYIEQLLGPEWGNRVDELASRRLEWRDKGTDMPAVKRLTDELIDRQGWLR